MAWPKGVPRPADQRARISGAMTGRVFRPVHPGEQIPLFPLSWVRVTVHQRSADTKRPFRFGDCQMNPCPWNTRDYPELQEDHIVPKFEGGTNDPNNIRWICPNCHHIKSQEERRRRTVTTEEMVRYMRNRHGKEVVPND